MAVPGPGAPNEALLQPGHAGRAYRAMYVQRRPGAAPDEEGEGGRCASTAGYGAVPAEVRRHVAACAFADDGGGRLLDSAPFSVVAQSHPDGSRSLAFCRRIRTHGNGDVCLVLISGLPWRAVFHAVLDAVAPLVANARSLPETLHDLDADTARRIEDALSSHARLRPHSQLADWLPPTPKESWRWASVLDDGQPSLKPWIFGMCDVTMRATPSAAAAPGCLLKERVNDILHVFAALLQERRIVVVADSVPAAASAVGSLVSCLYPMRWQGLLFPVVPPNQTDVLYGSMPYVAGIHASLLDKLVAMGSDVGEVVLLDLRRESENQARLTILNASQDAAADVPRLSEEDEEAFSDFDATDLAQSLPRRRRYELEEALLYLMAKPDARYRDELALNAFLRFFVGCFASLPRHFVREAPPGGSHPDHAIIVAKDLWYDHRGFLDNTVGGKRGDRAFYLLLRQTTHFAQFVAESLEGKVRNNADKGYGGMFEYVARQKELQRRSSYTEIFKQGMQRASLSVKTVRRAYTSSASTLLAPEAEAGRMRRTTSAGSALPCEEDESAVVRREHQENWRAPVPSAVDPRWVVPSKGGAAEAAPPAPSATIVTVVAEAPAEWSGSFDSEQSTPKGDGDDGGGGMPPLLNLEDAAWGAAPAPPPALIDLGAEARAGSAPALLDLDLGLGLGVGGGGGGSPAEPPPADPFAALALSPDPPADPFAASGALPPAAAGALATPPPPSDPLRDLLG